MNKKAILTTTLILVASLHLLSSCGRLDETLPTNPLSGENQISQDGGNQDSNQDSQRQGISKLEKPVSIPGAFPSEGGVPMFVHLFDADSYDPDGEIVMWEWNFSEKHDGSGGWHDFTETNGDAWHLYDHPGTMVAHLRVTDIDGNKDTAFVKISLSAGGNTNPVAVANAEPTMGYVPLEVTFNAEGSYDPDGVIIKYEWDFGDGVFYDFTGTNGNAIYTYTKTGNCTAILRVTDDDGAISTDGVEIVVYPPPTWVHTWGGADYDWAAGIEVADGGNVYVAGTTRSFGAGEEDVVVLKYDTLGNVVWKKTWGGSLDDRSHAIVLHDDDSIYIAGETWSFGAGGGDILILKYSTSGDLLWQKTWGGGSDEVAYHDISLAVDAHGDVYLAGDTRSFGLGSADIIFLKYSSDGDLIWQKTWGGSGIDQAPTALAIEGSGNIYLACRVRGFGSANSDTVLIKYSPAGDLIWQRMWGGTGHDYAYDITLDESDNIYIVGVTHLSFGAGWDELILYKYDPDGNLGWRRTWGGSAGEHGLAITFDNTGNLYVGGITRSFGLSGGDMVLLRYSLDGDLLLEKTWGESPEEAILDLAMDSSGNLYIAGKANNIFSEWQDVSGQTSSPSGTEGIPGGSNVGPVGIETTPLGTETLPDGVEDEGGGVSDILVMKVDPSSL